MLTKKDIIALRSINVKKQIDYIESKILSMIAHPRVDGDTSFLYKGHLFPEVKGLFKDFFDITCSEQLLLKNGGIPVYLFTLKDNIGVSVEIPEKEREIGIESFKSIREKLDSVKKEAKNHFDAAKEQEQVKNFLKFAETTIQTAQTDAKEFLEIPEVKNFFTSADALFSKMTESAEKKVQEIIQNEKTKAEKADEAEEEKIAENDKEDEEQFDCPYHGLLNMF